MRKEAATEEWKKLYELGIRFKKEKPWEWLDNMEPIEVSFAEEDTACFLVMGYGGQRYGFSMFFGPDAWQQLLLNYFREKHGIDEDFLFQRQNCISMFLSDKEEVPEEQRQVIRDLKLRFRGQFSWIYFERYEPGYLPFHLNQEEVRLCTRFLEKFFDAMEFRKKTVPKGVHLPNQFTGYRFRDGEWNPGSGRYIGEELQFKRPLLASEEQKEMFRSQKRRRQIWELDSRKLHSQVRDPDYDKPLLSSLLLLAERKKGTILNHELLTPEDEAKVEETICSFLASAIMQEGRPQKVVVANGYLAAVIGDLCGICDIPVERGDTRICRDAAEQLDNPGDRLMREMCNTMGMDYGEMMDTLQGMGEEEAERYLMEKLGNFLAEEGGPGDGI